MSGGGLWAPGSVGRKTSLTRLKVVDDVLLGRDRDTVASGGTKVPIFERCQNFLVDCAAQTLNHGSGDDVSAFVDGDLYDHVALCESVQIVGRNPRLRRGDRKGGPDLRTGIRAFSQRSIRRTSRRSGGSGGSGFLVFDPGRGCVLLGCFFGTVRFPFPNERRLPVGLDHFALIGLARARVPIKLSDGGAICTS